MPGGDEVIGNLKRWSEELRAATILLAQNWAGQLEARAKQNASWRDRTSNARNGLYGSAGVEGLMQNQVSIKLGHSMDYGVFLELCNDGKYAVLKPTLDAAVAEIYESYRRLWTA